MSINRSIPPALHPISEIKLPPYSCVYLSNGIPVYIVKGGTQEVLRAEFFYLAGRWFEPHHAIAAITAKMLSEGTVSKSANQIAETFDFYGATFNTEANIDHAVISMQCLSKHAAYLIPLIYEMISAPSFPKQELATYVQNSKQRLEVNLQKVDFIAHKTFNEQLYGINHPVGYTVSATDYDTVLIEMLREFHSKRYRPQYGVILLSGNVDDSVIKMLDDLLGKDISEIANRNIFDSEVRASSSKQIFVPKEDAVQCAIHMGAFAVNKFHPDFHALRFTNVILGGYFGSRLMSNLREEKGYCYGIHSGIMSYLHGAHFYIATEVHNEVSSKAVNEIYVELERMCSEPVPDDEMQLVKDYLMGVYLGDIDGPLNASNVIKGLVLYGLDENYFSAMIKETQSISSDIVMKTAQKYFDPNCIIEVVAGLKPVPIISV